MANASSYSLCLFRVHIFMILVGISLSNASGNSSVTWSKFHLIKSADVRDPSIVTKIYPDTDSSLTCALLCKHHATESFYQVTASSTCYCNKQADASIVADDAGTMVYGYLVQPGTAAQCQHMYDTGARTDGELTTSSGKKILCNLTSLGWIVFQRRQDGSVEFQRNWDEYVAGFGDTNGEFWLGLEELHQLTQVGCELHVYLEAEPDHPVQAKGYARYSNFSVGAAVTNYTLYVDGFSGNVGDSLNFSSGCPFSTYDCDHDVWADGNCALVTIGGWWHTGISYGTYKVCHEANMNSVYLGGQHQLWSGIRWTYPWEVHYSLLRTEMAFRCS